ncbi:hypothetical protein ACLB2K_074443 [Fragaria x ananassa]
MRDMSYGGFSLPNSFRFQPSDEELLSYYLQKKNPREDPEITAIIPEIDVSKHEPRDLAEFLDREWFTMADSPDMEWYFFSPRVFKHSNSTSQSTKVNRTTGEGFWKKQGNDRRITGACSDKQIGGKRILTFYLPKKQKTDWVIHEYYLTKANSDEQIGDFVLCRLKDNHLKKKSGKSEHDRQDAPLCNGVVVTNVYRYGLNPSNYGGFSLPKGFRFQPSDEVLLSHYLQKKNQREDPEITAIIPEIDVTKHEPRDLPALVFTRAEFLDKEWFTMADSPDMEWYFFSPRVFKHSNSKSQSTKINRTTKEGSWKKQGNDRRITGACSDKQIGGRRILTFYLSKKKKTDWVIHEYYLTKADSDEQIGDFVLCRLKDNRLKKKKSGKPDHDRQDAPGDQAFNSNDDEAKAEHGGGSCSMALNVESPASKQLENVLPIRYGNDDDADHGGGSCHIVPGMLTEAEEYQGFNALQDAVSESNGNEQEFGGSQTVPCYIDKNDRSVSIEGQPDSEMVEERLHEPEDVGLLHPPPSTRLQSPIYTKRTNNIYNDEYRKRKYPFGDSEPFLTKKNHTDEVDSNTSSNSENQAADASPEVYSQPGGNLGSDLFRSQTLPSINREPRDLPHDNNFIVWDDLPTIIDDFEFSLANFSYTFIDRGINDRNIEGAYGSANDYNALAIGETLQCT